MTLDGITLYCIVKELRQSLPGARIDKIYMPSRDEINLLLRVKNENRRLKISSHPNFFRMHLTAHADKNPDTPPVFCMFLRKHLTNAIIEDITMYELERVVMMDILSRDEMGVQKPLIFILELMGKNSNIILADQNSKVMECQKHVGVDVSRLRQILPTIAYTLPPGDKINPLALSEGDLEKIILAKGQKNLANHLCAVLQGLSQPTVNEIIYYIEQKHGDPTPLQLAQGIKSALNRIMNGDTEPHTAADPYTGKEFFSMLSYGSLPSARNKSANGLLDDYYFKQSSAQKIQKQKDMLLKLLQKHIDKREKKLQIQLETLEEARQAEAYRKKADLITANIYRLKKGMEFLDAVDYYSQGETLRIMLDQRLTPSANAQKYYKRYNKLKSAASITMVQLQENKEELAFLYSEQVSLQNSETEQELEEIAFELIKTGYYAEKKGQKIKQKETASTPHAFVSSDGFSFYAGKNNRQNDLLTLKFAGLNDIWMHIKDFAGAHVIIKCDGKEVPPRTLEEAAAIAAYLSRAKSADKIPVDYTQRKNVKKPSGAKPGMVIYDHYRTVFIKPDADTFMRLKQNK